MQFSRVCCSTRMHEDDARWPTVHTTGALSDGTPPDFDAGIHSFIRWLVDRKTSNAARAIRCLLVSFFAWDARLCAPAPSLIAASRPSCLVCRLQRRRSARRSSLSARLPGLPSRWPAYFFVRLRGTCSARAAVVGFCARPWGRITLQWRDGALPGPFKRRGCVCAGAACVRHASAPHSLHIPKCGESAHRVLLRSDMYGGQRSNICEWPAPRPSVRPRAGC